MPPIWVGHPDYDVTRDFKGYGEKGLNPKWPNDAKIAVSFVINYEEVNTSTFLLHRPTRLTQHTIRVVKDQ